MYVFAYNQEATVRESCIAALNQEYENLEVVFSDDFSRDSTFEVMQDVARGYRGPHDVRLNRNERNLGLIGHVNRSAEIASGELIVAAAGDDVSLPERTRAIVDAYVASGRTANSIHSAVTQIDARGAVLGIMRPPVQSFEGPDVAALRYSLIIGASHAWSRRVFEVFGPIQSSHTFEDLVICVRSLLLGPVVYIDRPLVNYRVGSGLTTSPRRLGYITERQVDSRFRLETLAQRRRDYARVGARVPRELERAWEYERMAFEVFSGDVLSGLRRLASAPWMLGDIIRRVPRHAARAATASLATYRARKGAATQGPASNSRDSST